MVEYVTYNSKQSNHGANLQNKSDKIKLASLATNKQTLKCIKMKEV